MKHTAERASFTQSVSIGLGSREGRDGGSGVSHCLVVRGCELRD